MKHLFCLLIVLGMIGCKVEPEPIQYGKDLCYACKMTLMDNKFGAEVVSDKGKVFKFDDANCMLNFLNSGYLEESKVKFRLIVDYTQLGKLIPVEHSFFLKSDEIRSPMNSSIAAFESEQAMHEFKNKWNATLLGWGELQTEFK